MNNEELQYSFNGLINSIRLFEDINQIHIVVEDKGKEAEYETIFKRLLDKEYKIEKIFAVGGKINVKRCYEELKDDSSLPLIFLVDGDFDRYKDPENMINDERFIYLETYNIESYFIDEKACVHFVKRYMCSSNEKEIKNRLNFSFWYTTIIQQAKDLFFIYCYLQKYKPETPNVQRRSYLFIDYKTGFKRDDNEFENFQKEIYESDQYAEGRIKAIIDFYNTIHGNDYSYLICGKFLFDSLKCYLTNIVNEELHKKSHIDDITLRWCLIDNFDLKKLLYIKDKINAVYPNTALH